MAGNLRVRDNQGNLALSTEAKAKAWKDHYEHLLNVEFPWSVDNLPRAEPVLGSPILITTGMVAEAINEMKQSKAPGPTGIKSLGRSQLPTPLQPCKWDFRRGSNSR